MDQTRQTAPALVNVAARTTGEKQRFDEAKLRAFEANRILPDLTSDQRLEIFSVLMEGYCDRCGGPARNQRGAYCKCRNEE